MTTYRLPNFISAFLVDDSRRDSAAVVKAVQELADKVGALSKDNNVARGKLVHRLIMATFLVTKNVH